MGHNHSRVAVGDDQETIGYDHDYMQTSALRHVWGNDGNHGEYKYSGCTLTIARIGRTIITRRGRNRSGPHRTRKGNLHATQLHCLRHRKPG